MINQFKMLSILFYSTEAGLEFDVLTHSVRLGGLDVHVARLFYGFHHQFVHAGVETLNIHVSEAKQFWEAVPKHDG